MTAGDETPSDMQAKMDEVDGLFEQLKQRVLRLVSRVKTHCAEVEEAKAVCDRENTRKHGKDWVNRCCG